MAETLFTKKSKEKEIEDLEKSLWYLDRHIKNLRTAQENVADDEDRVKRLNEALKPFK